MVYYLLGRRIGDGASQIIPQGYIEIWLIRQNLSALPATGSVAFSQLFHG